MNSRRRPLPVRLPGKSRLPLLLAGILASIGLMNVCLAGEWPQILGPHRNGVANAEQLADHWGPDGPPVLWETPVGSGFAGVAVQGNKVAVFHRIGRQEILEIRNAETGKQIWHDAHPTDFRPQVGEGDGPLCTPVIHHDRVITFGAQGVLSCHDLKSGQNLWTRHTHADFGAREGYFGAGSTPLVLDDLVIVNVGGFRSQASVVAFDLKTGKTKWQLLDDHASYSSPIPATVDGVRHVILITRLHCLAVDPKTGHERFRFPFGQRGPTVNAATPVIDQNRLFLTASYGIGAIYGKVHADHFQQLWAVDDLYSSQYCTPVVQNGIYYGIDGRQDIPPAVLKCFDPDKRRLLWTKTGLGYGTLILADDKLIIVSTDGRVTLAAADPSGYKELATARVLPGTIRALPALAQGRLYVRDEKTLKCLLLGTASNN